MENAAKALIIVGGMLIALLIIGALLLMFNQIGDYEKGQQNLKTTSEIAEFNMDYIKFAEDKDVKGVDIISLANKVVDFNKKDGIVNSIDHSKKITLKISYNGKEYNDAEEIVNNFVKYYQDYEKKYTVDILKKENIAGYNIYDTFKFTEFKCDQSKILYHDNGQIKEMTFKV